MTIDELKSFCCLDGDRPNIDHPFTQGIWTFATNAKVLVRVSAMKGIAYQAEPVVTHFYLPAGPEATFANVPMMKAHKCEVCVDEVEKGCDECWEGLVFDELSTPVGVREFQSYYLWKIGQLPGCQIEDNGHPSDPARFRFVGGVGVLMPLKPSTKPLDDSSRMPFGQHQGQPMEKLPAKYLHYLWTHGIKEQDRDGVGEYIRKNLDALQAEYADGIW